MRFLFGSVALAGVLVYAAGSIQSPAPPIAPAVGPGGMWTPSPNPSWVPSGASPGRPAKAGLAPHLARIAARGDEQVPLLVRLDEPALLSLGRQAAAGQRMARVERIRLAQDAAVAALARLGGRTLGRLRNLTTAVLVEAPARLAPEIAGLPGVIAVHPIRDFRLYLSETVPYLGADVGHAAGVDGSGIIVSVLDTGIDYTHASLGGPGTEAAYNAAYYGSPLCRTGQEPECANRMPPDPGLVGPGAPKVITGFDFIGEVWDGSGPLEPDSNPIDFNGHGTHVGDAIAGASGVAPGADLAVFKVCSSMSGVCSGVALAQAFDAAMDLDGSPRTVDPTDVINLSLGNPFGQPEDGLIYLVDTAAGSGVVVVAAAGQAGDQPYGVSSPAIADGAIGVGGVQHPTAELSSLFTPTSSLPMIRQLWSPAPPGSMSGGIEYLPGSAATRYGCLQNGENPFPSGSLAGRILIVDRSTCTFTEKAMNAGAAGAVAVIQADFRLQSPNELPGGGENGGHPVLIPAYTMNTLPGLDLKAMVGMDVVIDPAADVSLIDAMLGLSGRGPRNNDSWIKPDLVAPGGASSARVGTGTKFAYLGGTSVAAAHVSGLAAMILQEQPSFQPFQVKTVLMNAARRDVYADARPENGGGYVAPVTWAGAGMADWNRISSALDAGVLAWFDMTGSASLGYRPITETLTFSKTLVLQNFSLTQIFSQSTSVGYRDPLDRSKVTVQTGEPVTVPPDSTVTRPISITTVVPNLDGWMLDKGSQGFDGRALDAEEVDGWFFLPVGGDVLGLPWHILPKRAAAAAGLFDQAPGAQFIGSVVRSNDAITDAPAELFQLFDRSPNRYSYAVGDCGSIGLEPGCEQSPVDLNLIGAGERRIDSDGEGTPQLWLKFAATLWDDPYRAAGMPVQVLVYLDTNQDSVDDYILFNSPVAGSDGANAVFLYDVATGASAFSAWTVSDFNTQAWILPVQAASVGLGAGEPFDFWVGAAEIYFGGTLWDCSPFPTGTNPCGVDRHTYTVSVPRFDLVGLQAFTDTIPAGGSVTSPITSTYPTAQASPSSLGLMSIYPLALVGREAEAYQFVVPGVDDDGDGADNGVDCDENDPNVFAIPTEVLNVGFGGAGIFTDTRVSWDSSIPTSGSATRHQVYVEDGGFGKVGNDPDGFLLATGLPDDEVVLDLTPAVGAVLRVLVQGAGSCGNSGWGFASSGEARKP